MILYRKEKNTTAVCINGNESYERYISLKNPYKEYMLCNYMKLKNMQNNIHEGEGDGLETSMSEPSGTLEMG